MKIVKKLSLLMLSVIMVFSLSVSAFAVTDSKNVTGYGTLKGSLNYSSKVTYSTSVTQNPDKASLAYKIQYLNKSGATLATTSHTSSDVTKTSGSRSSLPSNTSSIYSTHEVKGGSKYSASALYLKLSV